MRSEKDVVRVGNQGKCKPRYGITRGLKFLQRPTAPTVRHRDLIFLLKSIRGRVVGPQSFQNFKNVIPSYQKINVKF